MTAIRHVAVVGAGLAGLAAALAAARAGMRVDVFEARAEPEAPAAHIDVVPNLLRDLAALGVAPACMRRGFPYRGFAVLDGDGQVFFEVATPHLAGARLPSALGMVYGELLAVLRDAVLAHGVQLHWGQSVCEADDRGVTVATSGARHAADHVVIASGERSPALAGSTPEQVPEQALPQAWCYALLPRPRAMERATWVIGGGPLRAMIVPVDAQRAGVAVLLQDTESGAKPPPAREALAGQGRLLRSLASHWREDTPVLVRPVRSGMLPGAWHAAGVLRIGRNAHRLPPHFGQAAAQAVEDACVLGDLLRAGLDRSALLDAFMARRGERARRVHDVSVQAARWQLRPEPDTDLHALAETMASLVAQPA
jgi:2-polyprenyl-6-methoxyphenol hydroxylase-like FAD-dependent oxidoreductase